MHNLVHKYFELDGLTFIVLPDVGLVLVLPIVFFIGLSYVAI